MGAYVVNTPPTLLTSEVVESEADLLALRPEWDRLSASAAPSGPFTGWAWVWHWWHTFRTPRDRLHVIAFRDAQRVLRGVAPFILTTVGASPLTFRVLRLYGWHTIELREPLVATGWEAVFSAALLERLKEDRDAYDWCIVRGIRAESYISAALASVANEYEPTSYYVLDLPSTWEALRGRLKRSMKKTLGHCYNTLSREGRKYELEIVDDPLRLEPVLDDFFRLHTARARVLNAPVAHPDQYRTEERRSLLRAVAADLQPRSRVMVCRLLVDGQLVASRLAFPVGDTLYLHHSGFDPDWWWYYVPTTLTAECIKMAIRSGFRAVNLSTGTDYSKIRWQPELRRATVWGIAAPTVRARVCAGSATALLRLHQVGQRRLRGLRARCRRLLQA